MVAFTFPKYIHVLEEGMNSAHRALVVCQKSMFMAHKLLQSRQIP